jgi:hypothetical protein
MVLGIAFTGVASGLLVAHLPDLEVSAARRPALLPRMRIEPLVVFVIVVEGAAFTFIVGRAAGLAWAVLWLALGIVGRREWLRRLLTRVDRAA